jgi:hypothetical protein
MVIMQKIFEKSSGINPELHSSTYWSLNYEFFENSG